VQTSDLVGDHKNKTQPSLKIHQKEKPSERER